MTVSPIDDRHEGFATKQLHSAATSTAGINPRATPIFLTAGFVLDDFDQAGELFGGGDGFSYTRVANPTSAAVEQRVAALEGGAEALESER